MNAITTKNETAMTVDSAWGLGGTSSEDMLIPRIQLMQPMSTVVTSGKANAGEIIDSVSGDILAKKGESVEFIPIMTFKEWRRFEFVDNEWKYLERVPFGPANASWKYEMNVNGVQIRNDISINAFVLLTGKTDDLPYLISFKRSSYGVGKKLSTYFQVCGMKKVTPALSTFKLSSQQQVVDKKAFYVFDLAKSVASKKEDIAKAFEWWRTLSASQEKVKVADESEAVPF